MSCLLWPALDHGVEPLPHDLSYLRGVWGKAHGAISDFRWLACSPGFNREKQLRKDLAIGNENRISSSSQWRPLVGADGNCYAVNGYTSRAADAYGRSGFLENQIVQWRRPATVPAALGALLLMAEVGELNDKVWWRHRTDERWQERSFVLEIGDSDCPAILVAEAALDALIGRGIESLGTAVNEVRLARLYAGLNAGARPTYLELGDACLSPLALAVLLLPLTRETADQVTLATWIPADQSVRPEQAAQWHIIAGCAPATYSALTPDDRARTMARTLLNNDSSPYAPTPPRGEEPEPPYELTKVGTSDKHPLESLDDPVLPIQAFQVRPGIKLDLPAADQNAPEIVHWLHRFACSADSRWIDIEEIEHLSQPLAPEGQEVRLIRKWMLEVQKQRPPLADPIEWQVKVEQLQAVALTLAPDPETSRMVGLPTSGRVPALLFAPLLGSGNELIEAYGSSIQDLIDQSLECTDQTLVSRIEGWCNKWL